METDLTLKNADVKTRVKTLKDLVIDEKNFGNRQREPLRGSGN